MNLSNELSEFASMDPSENSAIVERGQELICRSVRLVEKAYHQQIVNMDLASPDETEAVLADDEQFAEFLNKERELLRQAGFSEEVTWQLIKGMIASRKDAPNVHEAFMTTVASVSEHTVVYCERRAPPREVRPRSLWRMVGGALKLVGGVGAAALNGTAVAATMGITGPWAGASIVLGGVLATDGWAQMNI